MSISESPTMPTLADINRDIDETLVRDPVLGTLHGRVCISCDVPLKKRESCELGFKTFLKCAQPFKGDHLDTPQLLRDEHRFKFGLDIKGIKGVEVLRDCLLSPRSKMQTDHKGRCPKVIMCRECKSGLTKNKLKENKPPRFAMARGMTIGRAPECIACLNEIELALVSQARHGGHLFSHWGGCHKSIKGWHSFYDVDAGHSMAAINSVSELTAKSNIAVVLCGPFTSEQKASTLNKTNVDKEKALAAFKWPKENNKLYADLEEPEMGQPEIIDTSNLVESGNADTESKEEITVVFPSGTVSTGGCENSKQFEEATAEIRSKTNDEEPILLSKPSQRVLRDYVDDNLMKAFPLQFPCGIGSHEDMSVKVSQNGHLNHLLRLSVPAFHESCFVLTAHNMFERSRMLTGSVWRVTGTGETCNVSEEELNKAVERKLKGLPPCKGPGSDFLKSIRTVRKFLGHTNEAAASAQQRFLSLTHHYGCPKLLFTVSFDDSLDIRTLTLSGHEDPEEWMSSLAKLDGEEVSSELGHLHTIRKKCPGLCSMNFEFLMDIALDGIVGDNEERVGVFGKLDACGMAVEEQGRKTLHAHLLVHLKGWNDLLRNLHSSRDQTRKRAEKTLTECVDQVVSTELIPDVVEDYTCKNCRTTSLDFADNENMRALRHRIGCIDNDMTFVGCPTCDCKMDGDECARSRMIHHFCREQNPDDVDWIVARDILHQRSSALGKINCRFNKHLSRHAGTCFEKGEECRAKLPDMPEDKTHTLRGPAPCELGKRLDWLCSSNGEHNCEAKKKSGGFVHKHPLQDYV